MMVQKTFEELTTDELYDLMALRTEIFVVEQDCAYQELDGKDKAAVHYWIEEDGQIVSAIRVLVTEQPIAIGRVVTKQTARGKGYSKRLIQAAVDKYGHGPLYLSSQLYVESFYGMFGFERVSEPYNEDNIPHVDMIREPVKTS